MRSRALGRRGAAAVVLAVVVLLGVAWRAQSHGTTHAGSRQLTSPAATVAPSTSPSTAARQAASDRPLGWAAAREALRTLRVLPRRPYEPDYQRDCGQGQGCVFGPAWTDDQDGPEGHNGCRTRDDVLRTSLSDVQLRDGSRCVVVAGVLQDPYTGSVIHFVKSEADAIEIDHIAPLAYVWDLGANRNSPRSGLGAPESPH